VRVASSARLRCSRLLVEFFQQRPAGFRLCDAFVGDAPRALAKLFDIPAHSWRSAAHRKAIPRTLGKREQRLIALRIRHRYRLFICRK
jgi:hypothetical protein